MKHLSEPKHARPVRDAIAEWIAGAPADLVTLMRRLTFHNKVKWIAADYVTAEEFGEGGDGRQTTDSLSEAEVLSSAYTKIGWDPVGPHEPKVHALVLDIDVPAWLIPSSTEGHSHLVVDLMVSDERLWPFLRACAAVGLVEPGYVEACKSRGMTSVRLPWIKKGEEPSTIAAQREMDASIAALAAAPDPWDAVDL